MFSDFLAPYGWPFCIFAFVSVWMALGVFAVVADQRDYRYGTPLGLLASLITILSACVLIFLFGTTAIFDWAYKKDSPMLTLFAFGGWCFYTLLVAELLGLVYCMRVKRGVTAAASILLTLFLLQVFGSIPIVSFLWANKVLALVALVGYFVVGGGLWSLWKWSRYSKVASEVYARAREKFLEEHGVDPKGDFPEELWKEFRQRTWYDDNYNEIEFFPDFRKHKSEITGWIVAWPLSMIESFILDFLLNLADWVYKKLSGAFEYITRFHWKQFDADRVLDAKLKKKK